MTRIYLPWPSRDLTPHAQGNWHKKAAATKKARSAAYWIAKEAGVKCLPDAAMTFTYYAPSWRGDCHNVHGRCKAYIDGIAQAMGCDDKKFRISFPPEFAGVKKNGEIIVDIEDGRDE